MAVSYAKSDTIAIAAHPPEFANEWSPMTSSASSLTDRAYTTIRRAILALELLPGQPLVEAQLARELKISKTPVREALQRLASEELIVLDRFRGASVRTVDADVMRDLFDVRTLLEPTA